MNDFFLLAGTILPVLLLTNNVGSFTMPLGRLIDPTTTDAQTLDELSKMFDRERKRMPRLALTRDVIYGAFFVLAEVVCLTALFHGHPTFGGPWIVWIALAMYGLQAVGSTVLDGSKDVLQPMAGDFVTRRLQGIQADRARRRAKRAARRPRRGLRVRN